MNILVVDDTEQGRYILETFLKAKGHAVAGAENGQEALEKLRVGTFDLIISGILMPVMDGFPPVSRCCSCPATRPTLLPTAGLCTKAWISFRSPLPLKIWPSRCGG